MKKLESDLGHRRAASSKIVRAERSGFVARIDAFRIGNAGVGLGVGRNTTEDDVLPNVGVQLRKKVGDHVDAGETLCVVYGESEHAASVAAGSIADAFAVDDAEPDRPETIVEELSAL